jgi:hypothetical protein
MNRFFFDIRRGDQVLADAEGTECRDSGVAAREAMIALGEMARDEVRTSTSVRMAIIVRDSSSREIAIATLNCELTGPTE